MNTLSEKPALYKSRGPEDTSLLSFRCLLCHWPKEDAGKQLLIGLQIQLPSHPVCIFMAAFCLYSKLLWSKTFVSYVSEDGRQNMREGCACLHWGLFSSNQKVFLFVHSVILQCPHSSTQLILAFSKSIISIAHTFSSLNVSPHLSPNTTLIFLRKQKLSWKNTYIVSLRNRLVFLYVIYYICRGTICVTIKSHVQQLCPGCRYTFPCLPLASILFPASSVFLWVEDH